MEFEVKTDLSVLPAVIESNAPEIRAELDLKLEFYRNLVVTPDTIKDGKQAKADLNKLKTAIVDKRKEVKRQCLDPYKAFEDACKEIETMIDDAVESIDKQLKEFARQVAIEKLNALQEYFMSAVTGMERDMSWVELGRILNPKWKNQTMRLEALKGEIWDTLSSMTEEQKELEKIYGGSPLYPAIWGKYLETYNKGETLAYAAVLIQQERQRQPEPPPMPAPEPVAEPVQIPAKHERTGTCAFRVIGTESQIIAVRDFMKKNAIRFEVVKNKEE